MPKEKEKRMGGRLSIKPSTKIVLASLIAAVPSVAVFAQTEASTHCYILKAEGDKFIPIDSTHNFNKGDRIKVSFENAPNGYVYIINITPEGKRFLAFPNLKDLNNETHTGEHYDLPRASGVALSHEGIEVFQIIMSRERIAFLDAAITPDGVLGDYSSGAAELSSDNVTRIQPGTNSVNTRSYESRNLESRTITELSRIITQLSKKVDQLSLRIDQLSRRVDRLSSNRVNAPRGGAPIHSDVKKKQGEDPTIVIPSSSPTGDVLIVNEKVSVIAIPDGKGGKLRAEEFIVFEFRLRVLQLGVRSR